MRLNTGSVAVLFALTRGLATAGFDCEYDFHVNHLQLDGITRTVANGQSSSISHIPSWLTYASAIQANTQVSGFLLVNTVGTVPYLVCCI